ncbi:cytochrome P450 monooxygenase-like protein [Rhexocercosporidium sp. MPI-PUGE-AT-0058]|nr:cytochrome P450 monooxygenase-like protein [Rhexocercosporidium sp. MPI-PUGE-AT-0058]
MIKIKRGWFGTVLGGLYFLSSHLSLSSGQVSFFVPAYHSIEPFSSHSQNSFSCREDSFLQVFENIWLRRSGCVDEMVGVVPFTLLLLAAYGIGKYVICLSTNIRHAKRTGLPYVVGPFYPIGFGWVFLAQVIGPILRHVPGVRNWGWLWLIDRQGSWSLPRVAEGKYGDTYLVVTPFIIFLKTSDAELGTQITTRKTDFLKPVQRYKIVDLFGKSILTQEGQEWKRHRKIVGPSFSEKSNRLVFEESVRQAEGMMDLWAEKNGNTRGTMTIENTAKDSATLSLHVICAAGFGVPTLWPNEGREKLGGKGIPGFSDRNLTGGHELSFQGGLTELLRQLVWFVIFPPWMLKNSPLKIHQSAYQAFHECTAYFGELLDIKEKQMSLGEGEKGTMDLLGPMIKANYTEAGPNSTTANTTSATLSREEILGNSFIFLFAGHETTANNIHFSILLLAINISTQHRMQADIDCILGSKSTSEFSYMNDMPRLWNSMVGAVILEELRLIPAILNIPKQASGEQTVTVDGTQMTLPDKMFLHLNVVGTNRNPRYWHDSPNDFMPERWLPRGVPANDSSQVIKKGEKEAVDGLENASFETSGAASLFKPIKGSFISFSEGQRACPGRRFAQVESTAVLSTLFQKYSVELDVSSWATDDEVGRMGREERRMLYEKAIERAEKVIRRSEQTITLQMLPGDEVPVRFVERGTERFWGCY